MALLVALFLSTSCNAFVPPSPRSYYAASALRMAGFGASKPKTVKLITLEPDALCPCGTGSAYQSCCGVYHSGKEVPSTPVKVVRARFSALFLKNVPYIISTTHTGHKEYASEERAGARRIWEKDLNLFVDEYRVVSIAFDDEARDSVTVLPTEGATALVSFTAKLQRTGVDRAPEDMKEVSTFKFQDGQWQYLDATVKNPFKNVSEKRVLSQQQRKVFVEKNGVSKSNQG